MKSGKKLALTLFTIGMVVSWQAYGDEYRVSGIDLCPNATSDLMLLRGPDDIWLAHQDGDTANVTICVPADSPGNAFVQWKSNGYWKATGNMRNSCAEIRGAHAVKIRAVQSNFHDVTTYYTCKQ